MHVHAMTGIMTMGLLLFVANAITVATLVMEGQSIIANLVILSARE